ncbi:MAG: hypothetical protein PHC75_10240 [Burkholderiales bacterium]|nr:hypothetical protein [Burkholderiales bacterium]
MFLVTSHTGSADKLIKELSKNNLNAIHFPIVELNKNEINVNDIKNIIADDAVFCISPSASLLAKEVLEKLDNNIIIAPGLGTANIIKEINPRLNIKFPLTDSGIDAVINDGIFFCITSISILGSNNINEKLLNFCRGNNIKITNIPLYNYNLCYKNQIKLLNSIVEKISAITGIIVTSSKVADGINYLMQFDSFKKKFSSTVFIASHYQIAEKLCFNKLNVKVSKNSSLEQVINSAKEVVCNGK